MIPKKVFTKSFTTFRTVNDLKRVLADYVERLNSLPSQKQNELINMSDSASEFEYIADRFMYDKASLDEDEKYVELLNTGVSDIGNKLTEYHEQLLSGIPIDVQIEKGRVEITIHSYLNRKDYMSAYLYHNLDNMLQAKLNHIKNEQSLYGLIDAKYKMELLRFVRKGASSSRVCDPSNIEVSYLINTICLNFGLCDAFNNMVEYAVKSVEVDKKSDEKTVIIVTNI